MSDIVGGKAISLVQRGGIEEVKHVRVFRVPERGYTIVFGVKPTDAFPRYQCTCAAGLAGRRCYHGEAAALLMAKERAKQQAIDKVRHDPTAKGPKWVGADGKHYPSSSVAAESFLKQAEAQDG